MCVFCFRFGIGSTSGSNKKVVWEYIGLVRTKVVLLVVPVATLVLTYDYLPLQQIKRYTATLIVVPYDTSPYKDMTG